MSPAAVFVLVLFGLVCDACRSLLNTRHTSGFHSIYSDRSVYSSNLDQTDGRLWTFRPKQPWGTHIS